jgi:hypothetical protein
MKLLIFISIGLGIGTLYAIYRLGTLAGELEERSAELDEWEKTLTKWQISLHQEHAQRGNT